ncbi:MAG: glycosyltransferase family 2 protein [Bacteroidota bacterium]|nr:glycosyltransferase family 2 protein [Bacteroidota bacterium]
MPVKDDLAPVVLFIYNRPKHTKQTLESLKKNKLSAETILYVFADGQKATATIEDKKNIKETRELIKTLTGFKQIVLTEKEKNDGLANSIILGVTDIINKHDKVIVLEDDLVVSPFFLDFMNEGLNIYRSTANIYSINGFMFPVKHKKNEVVLLPYTSTWGWATWKDKWKIFDPEMKGKEALLSNKKLASEFNLGSNNYIQMLKFKNNSWGIKWYYSVFMKKGLNIFPTRSLVTNIGFDGSGTNCEDNSPINASLSENKIEVKYIESIDPYFYKNYVNYFHQNKTRSLIKKTINYFKK